MANIIIGIHGLGNKPPESVLKRWWKLSMNEGLIANNFRSFVSSFDLVFWADILHEKLLDPDEADAESPLFIDEKYQKTSDNFQVEDFHTREKVIDYLAKQMNRIFLNEDLTLNYSFISDAIISRYFKDLELYYSGITVKEDVIEDTVDHLIRKRLCIMLEKHRNDDIMLISHSMGSIVAFDVLTFMVPDIRIKTFITMGSPLGFPVVISRIAAEHKKKGISGSVLRTPPGITGNWYNFSDIQDKVSFNHKLSEYYSANTLGVKPIDFLVINNYENNGERNPHKSYGYLRAPEFSKILNEFIVSEKISMGRKVVRTLTRLGHRLKYKISSK
jgi:hypothetical protein